MENKCIICKADSIVKNDKKGRDGYEVSCQRCGNYLISGLLAGIGLDNYGNTHLISGIVRNRAEMGNPIELNTASIENLFDSNNITDDPFELIDLLIIYIAKKAGEIQNPIHLNINNDFSLLYLKNKEEFKFYVNKAKELDYLEFDSKQFIRLTLNGWKRVTELRKRPQKSNHAFVAMWFDQSLDEIWENGFKSGLSELGFNPQRIDLTEHNEKICDRIISEIRQSSLLLADFTGQRGGVYFEAGFAMGLGIPVIWSCSEDDVENLHFDTRQYNHIVWKNAQDLKVKLINRIKATII